jgi:UDP-glucose 4-epimerase
MLYNLCVRVLITGGAGFIGSNLVRTLLDRPHYEVVVIDDLSTGNLENINSSRVHYFPGSILDTSVLTDAMKGCSAVVHLAARPSVPRSIQDPMATHQANSTGTLAVLEAARGQEAHVIVASSSSVYGANPKLPKVETMLPMPMSPYAVSKLTTESYALAWGQCFDLPTLAFRFFNVYGPRQMAGHAYAAVIPAFLNSAIRGDAVTMHGDGTQSRDFTFVDTVTSVIEEAISRRVTCDSAVNLALGSRVTLNQLVEKINLITGQSTRVTHEQGRAGDVPHSSADSTLLESLFPAIHQVPIDLGLRRTYDWLLKQSSAS